MEIFYAVDVMVLVMVVGGLLAARERVAELEAAFLEEHLENSWRRVTGTFKPSHCQRCYQELQ